MRGADQARCIWVVTYRSEVDGHFGGFENHAGAADDQFADAAGAEAAADGQARGVAPRLQLHKPADHLRDVLREILDRALHIPRCLGFADREELIQSFSVQIFGRAVAEGSSPCLRSSLRKWSMTSPNALLVMRSPRNPSSSRISTL